MRILLTGGTGFVGGELGKKLTQAGHEVIVLTRSAERARAKLSYPCHLVEWSSEEDKLPQEAVKGVEAVFNMAGEGIADGRWTSERKKSLRHSRVSLTHHLIHALKSCKTLKIFVSFSAVGIYGDRQDALLNEKSPVGKDFLAELCQEWERAAEDVLIDFEGVRLIIPRLGVVLGENQSFLDRLEPLFRSGLGGRLGAGEQYVSWIHVADLVNFLMKTLKEESLHGVYNLTAPQPVTNRELTSQLAKAFHVNEGPTVPSFALKMLYGEMSEVLLKGQRVHSQKLKQQDFLFPSLTEALGNLYGDLSPGEARFRTSQWLPQNPQELQSFCVSEEENLKKLMPSFLKWQAHQTLNEVGSGTLIEEDVVYRFSLGSVGSHLGAALTLKRLKKIFAARHRRNAKKFFAPSQSK